MLGVSKDEGSVEEIGTVDEDGREREFDILSRD